jgi:hypothetical protein
MVRNAKELLNDKEILITANPKFGNVVKDDTLKLVHELYDDDYESS